jgi:ABC-type glycerol-3-phosphate transport system permease component
LKAAVSSLLRRTKNRVFKFFNKIKSFKIESPSKKPKITLSTVIVHVVAWLIAIIWLIPFLGVFIASIRPFSEVQFGWWNIHPFTLTFKNFVDAWVGATTTPLSTAMLNSLIVTIPATV